MSEPKQAPPQLVEVTLAKPHTHAGVPYDTGAKIKVSAPIAKWLADHKIINAPAAAKDGGK